MDAGAGFMGLCQSIIRRHSHVPWSAHWRTAVFALLLGTLLCTGSQAASRFVALNGLSVPPYDSMATAARNIQDAVDVANSGDTIWVAPGTYDTGSTNAWWWLETRYRLSITKPVTVWGMSGASQTFIKGAADIAGVHMLEGCLRGVTVTDAHVARDDSWEGGGVHGGFMVDCVVSNCSSAYGGGVQGVQATNCVIVGNTASIRGGGAENSVLDHCTIIGNRAERGGGVFDCTLRNCIVYYNEAPDSPNHRRSRMEFSCTTPQPATGRGNIDADPGLAGVGNFHLLSGSPCIDAADPLSVILTDVDGQTREAGRADMGADERAVTSAGSMQVSLQADSPHAFCAGWPLSFRANSEGIPSSLIWSLPDGSRVTNTPVLTRVFAAGTHTLTVEASADGNRVTASTTFRVLPAATNYVSVGGGNIFPYDRWETAARNIQDAVDACPRGGVVLVAPGTYDQGGYGMQETHPFEGLDSNLAARVVISREVVLRSLVGPAATKIVGMTDTPEMPWTRCVFAATNAWIEGFSLTQGHTRPVDNAEDEVDYADAGAGIYCFGQSVTVTNCMIFSNGVSGDGGGVYRGTLFNCVLTNNTAGGDGGAVEDCVLHNCRLSGNQALRQGGGIDDSYAVACELADNRSGREGGAADDSELIDCVIRGNYGTRDGGGLHASRARTCELSGNSTGDDGGGSSRSELVNCRVLGNTAADDGGGIQITTAAGCYLYGNTAGEDGGGADESNVYGSTVCSNTAIHSAGGVSASFISNSISYYNTAQGWGPNHEQNSENGSIFINSCTFPATRGGGSITNVPLLAGLNNPHLLPASPCIDVSAAASGELDIDGQPREIAAADMGCDEYQIDDWQTPLTLEIQVPTGRLMVGKPATFSLLSTGNPLGLQWSWGDGKRTEDLCQVERAFGAPGVYSVRVSGYDWEGAVVVTAQVTITTNWTCYVSPQGGHIPPYTNWSMAARDIQTAVNSTLDGDTVVVTNGVYAEGISIMPAYAGDEPSRVAISNSITVRSVNGPAATIIEGSLLDDGVRCVHLRGAATLVGFTLQNGGAGEGPGVYCTSTDAVLSGCVIRRNRGTASVVRGTLYNCLVAENFSASYFGGPVDSVLYNCTVVRNEGDHGSSRGGGCVYDNCIVAMNAHEVEHIIGSNVVVSPCLYLDFEKLWESSGAAWNYSNIVGFVDPDGGDYRLLASSPAVDTGSGSTWVGAAVTDYAWLAGASGALYANGATWARDLEGKPRHMGAAPDCGAYETVPPSVDLDGDGIPDGWEWTYADTSSRMGRDSDMDGDGLGDLHEYGYGSHPLCSDTDADGMGDGAEFRAGTGITDADSALRMEACDPRPPAGSGLVVAWTSVPGKTYDLYRGTNLMTAFQPVATGLVATGARMSVTDTTAIVATPYYYRILLN